MSVRVLMRTERLKQLDVPHSVSQILPEAPASANVYLTIQGRKVQLTPRDHDENSLLSRMELLLNRFPEESPEPTTPPEGWCPIHQVQMKRYSNQKGSWWAHRIDGKWCRGKLTSLNRRARRATGNYLGGPFLGGV